ncbi:MAG: hypothetical protein P1V34_18835 [Alphaproteobacteria bacterium]|nr:hypothetical protein [Alphaproteobacteria bacterium]
MSEIQTKSWMTPDADIELYATGMYRARGLSARETAMTRAKTLKEIGDREGHRVWRAVADRITLVHTRAK